MNVQTLRRGIEMRMNIAVVLAGFIAMSVTPDSTLAQERGYFLTTGCHERAAAREWFSLDFKSRYEKRQRNECAFMIYMRDQKNTCAVWAYPYRSGISLDEVISLYEMGFMPEKKPMFRVNQPVCEDDPPPVG